MPRIANTCYLHQEFWSKVVILQQKMVSAEIQLRIYETVRTPFRQVELYHIGRMGDPRRIVTRAKAWHSKHQYGLAVDMVFLVKGKWTWSEPSPGMWSIYQSEAKSLGLVYLPTEKPHVEFDCQIDDLIRGRFPGDGGALHTGWLETQIETWGRGMRTIEGIVHPSAPPFTTDRPGLDE